MNIETQTTPELKHIAELIKGIATSMLTTIEADGSLASRPMYALEMDASWRPLVFHRHALVQG